MSETSDIWLIVWVRGGLKPVLGRSAACVPCSISLGWSSRRGSKVQRNYTTGILHPNPYLHKLHSGNYTTDILHPNPYLHKLHVGNYTTDILHPNPYLHKLQMSPTMPTHRISALCGASAPVKLLYCPRCRNIPAVEGWVHPEHEWVVILSCPSGSCPRWSVCRACPKARAHLDSEESFAQHKFRYHHERERSTQVLPGNFVTSNTTGRDKPPTPLNSGMSLGSSSCSESDDGQDSEIGNRVALQFLPYDEENFGDTGGEAQGGADDGFHRDPEWSPRRDSWCYSRIGRM
jgi:hypothetical protein